MPNKDKQLLEKLKNTGSRELVFNQVKPSGINAAGVQLDTWLGTVDFVGANALGLALSTVRASI